MEHAPAPATPLTDDDYAALNAILDDLATRGDGIPSSWEYCDGFLAALLCSRRPLAPSDYFPLLFGGDDGGFGFGSAVFRDGEQMQTFLQLWQRRRDAMAAALAAPVETLDDERALEPYVEDVRGYLAALPQAERDALAAELGDTPPHAFGQLWALGFLDVVQAWAEDWRTPRDRELARDWDDALADLAALAEDDTDAPGVNMHDEAAPPSVSEARLALFGDAIWSVYDLYDIARTLGPPIATVRKAAEPGRNDPCPCGSGKKYKKCCGAG